ncbi:Cytochrome C oxidase, cbb3-type, subunit III [Flexibacter flexilis DSM 6793]|uniref:Cytochrome C oxidase, cbb3-type, subunit III n=1 Tax=Flexibacter flexilis DSM 6793 TaxID=927664 RepID=A0A1I1M066_9BACT|nr:c-type cytochrome [Flexibacter flexilis]SFC75080.1 Cytochrome C oxidase, cbb3-type, subunit III [Flexibacter flexilis DSM 6793]
MSLANRLLVGVLAFGAAITYNSCKSEYLEDINPVCFQQDVQPIFVSKCTQSGCHNSQDREHGYDLTTYESIVSQGISAGNFRKSELYKILVQPVAQMPPNSHGGRLSDDQITKIALWIEQGAKNTTCEATTCNTTNITYSLSVKPIMDNYCIGCHGDGDISGNVDLSNYNGVKAAINQKLISSINHDGTASAMPENGAKLSNCNISIIQAWIDAGAPNN